MDALLIFRCETDVFLAKRALKKGRIESEVRKITDYKEGCASALSVDESSFFDAVRLLRENNIEYTLAKNDLS